MNNESTPAIKVTRKYLYEQFPYLQNLSMRDMISLIAMCFQTKSDEDLIYAIKCYMHSYPELSKKENMDKIYSLNDEEF